MRLLRLDEKIEKNLLNQELSLTNASKIHSHAREESLNKKETLELVNLSLISIPRIRFSGKVVERPNKRPPYPHPISIILTFWFCFNSYFLG